MRQKLFQQELAARPFWMLVACQLVNRARWSVAEPILKDRLMSGWPWPDDLAAADLEVLTRELKPLGLQRVRAVRLQWLATVFDFKLQQFCKSAGIFPDIHLSLGLKRADVLDLPGCGAYAADSWAIFVEKRRDLRPKDKELRRFLKEECVRARHDATRLL